MEMGRRWPGLFLARGMTVAGQEADRHLTAKNLVGLSVSDGKLLWQVPFEAAQGNNTTPIVDGQTVIYTGQGKGLLAVKIESQGERFAATPLWTNASSRRAVHHARPQKRPAFGYNGSFFCASAKTGATLLSIGGSV